MKVETDRVLLAQPFAGADEAAAWRRTTLALLVTAAAILLLYRQTAGSMMALWSTSDTYAHGWLILPIAAALVWRERRALAAIAPRPDVLGFALLAAAGFAWLIAAAGEVQVVQQYAMTAMLPAAFIALAGRRAARAIAFPLAFILLAVPFGEAFLPRMMDWTADFTIAALRLTGIPVYREGTYFAIPSGHWSVVEACSGLRYLIASVTVGALFAYLNYRRWWKRGAFLAASIVVPIFANFLRAYLIVMIGHLSDMKLAVGVDHFLYGWVFFGVVMLLLFWLGSFWRDPPSRPQNRIDPGRGSPRPRAAAGAALGAVAIAAAWPAYAAHLERPWEEAPPVLAAPAGAAGWSEIEAPWGWRPRYGGAAASVFQAYRKDGHTVVVFLGLYQGERPEAKLVSSTNSVESPPQWPRVASSFPAQALGAGLVRVRETHLRLGGGRLLVWEWFRIGGRELGSPYLAKALLARDKLLGVHEPSAVLIVAAPYELRPEAAAEALREFMRDMRPSLEAALEEARR